MRRVAIALLVAALLTGCAGGGELRSNGSITACGGHHTDPQACGYAIWNAKVAGQVQQGMSREEVRAIMKHDTERRELSGATETWYYITDYQAERMTTFTFTDGKLSAIGQAPWKTE